MKKDSELATSQMLSFPCIGGRDPKPALGLVAVSATSDSLCTTIWYQYKRQEILLNSMQIFAAISHELNIGIATWNYKR